MDIKDKTVMVLGGSGLVGMAICRKVLAQIPRQLVILALTENEINEGAGTLRREYHEIPILPVWGNIFVRTSLKDRTREELLSNPENRRILIGDVLDNLNEDILTSAYLFHLIERYHPDIIVDCINTATALAYQDIFLSSLTTIQRIEKFKAAEENAAGLIEDVEKLLCTQYVPQLIRHIQILYEATRRFKTQLYFKIGTSGTGGMGLNIPYTHSEERPSRVLLSKSSVAGAHSLLLFLMARTPDAPIIKEIKPTAVIAWKKITFGKITRHGKPIELYDCNFSETVPLDDKLHLSMDGSWKRKDDQFLEAPYIDTGENGMFSKSEFQTITTIGQMGFVTPEEIATDVMFEIMGGNTGHDIINAFDNACMGPTYRAGSMRHYALEKLAALEKEHGADSVAFELLGPPRLSKLLYEAYLLKRVGVSLNSILESDEKRIAGDIEKLLRNNAELRSKIISIGIPILTADGKHLLRGRDIKIPPFRGKNTFEITVQNIDKWAHDGWIDLREHNIRLWKDRFRKIMKDIDSINPEDTSSHHQWNREYWLGSAHEKLIRQKQQ